MNNISDKKKEKLSYFGFSFKKGGVHSSRTMMLNELEILLSYVNNPEAIRETYVHAIINENCLGKRSEKTRYLTYKHLIELYSLDPAILIYRAMLYFWNRDEESRPLLALLCAFSRDTILRSSASFILKYEEDEIVRREDLEKFIDEQEPGRFSKATLTSTAQNINSTWTKSGHLEGRVKKIRRQVNPEPGSIAFALLLGYLIGLRGELLFESDFIKAFDCSAEKAKEIASDASRKGWIVFKRIGDVIEVLFPNLITEKEMELVREQN